MRQNFLRVLFELASDFQSADERRRSHVLGTIDERGSSADDEKMETYAAFLVRADSIYRRIAAAPAADTYGYISALRNSYSRFEGAQLAGDRDWAAKQLKAAQEYSTLLANALTAEADQSDRDLGELQKMSFAVRRSSADQAAFAQELKRTGLGAERLELMRKSGRTDAEITEFEKQIVQPPPEKLGVSPAEMLAKIVESQRALAAELTRFAQATPGALAARNAQAFDVANPHDKEQTIDLFIRPVSIPPDWKLSVVNAEDGQPQGQAAKPGKDPAQYPVREVEAGKHYTVRLPAKAQVQVASIVVPVGEVGTNTTARWAVEGKIGDELIGGMVHEMNVPYIIADLQLPPVGSVETEEAPVTGRHLSRAVLISAVAAALLVAFLLFVIFWRRRRDQSRPTGSA